MDITKIKKEAKDLMLKNSVWLPIGLLQIIVSYSSLNILYQREPTLILFSSLWLTLFSVIVETMVITYVWKIIHQPWSVESSIDKQFVSLCSGWDFNVFGTLLLMDLFISLWAFIPIVGPFIAIVKSFAYVLAPYIALGGKLQFQQAITESRKLMMGHKMEFFLLGISFIGWVLLSLLTFGLLMVFVGPWMLFATSLAAKELLRNA